MSITATQWVAVSQPSDIGLHGIDVEVQFGEKVVDSIVIRDCFGNALRIVKADYGMKVYVPLTVDKWRVQGHVGPSGHYIDVFDTEDEAIRKARELNEAFDGSVLTVEKLKVPA